MPANSDAAGMPGSDAVWASTGSVLRESVVDPVVQAGQGGLDDGESLLEVLVLTVVGVFDVEGIGPRARIEGTQHPQSAVVDPELAQEADMVASQPDDQICREMVVLELGGAVVGGVAVVAQHALGPS